MKTLAIITARGGSKRIPRKNIKEFCGKPILAYSIEAALKSGLFDEVMVSTDDKEIAEVAKKYGAQVPFFRSEKTSNDFATTGDVLKEVLDMYKDMGKKFDYYACIYPTAPFVTAERLKDCYQEFLKADTHSLMPVVRFSFPPQRGLKIVDGSLEYVWPENALKRSQDLEPMYHDCGQFYFYSTDPEKKGITPYILPEIEVQDIDNIEDWEIAEVKYKMLHKEDK